MKKLLKLIAPILVIVLIYFGVTQSKKNADMSDKNITLNFKVKEDEEYTVFKTIEYSVRGEATLGDVFDKINGEEIEIVLEGEKDSEWGRYIVSINDHASNGQTAPFWLINSETNTSCLELGFCNGLDSQTMEDNDVFEFVFE